MANLSFESPIFEEYKKAWDEYQLANQDYNYAEPEFVEAAIFKLQSAIKKIGAIHEEIKKITNHPPLFPIKEPTLLEAIENNEITRWLKNICNKKIKHTQGGNI